MASVERCTQDGFTLVDIDQPRTTTPTSITQPSLAAMTIKDDDQSNKNARVSSELNMLRVLSIDDTNQSPKKSEDKTSGWMDPIPANIYGGANGNKLTSGFSGPKFGQTATPIKNSSFTTGRNSPFDNISSNEPSFSELAKSGRTAFGNSPPFGTSNPSIEAFGSGIPSDADQRNISAESSIKTKSSHFADDVNSENAKQRGDGSLGREHPQGSEGNTLRTGKSFMDYRS